MVQDVVEYEVVPVAPAGEVLLGVVNNVIGTEGSDEIDVPSTAHASHHGAERPGDLHSERPNTSGRTVDQDAHPRRHLAQGPHRRERRET